MAFNPGNNRRFYLPIRHQDSNNQLIFFKPMIAICGELRVTSSDSKTYLLLSEKQVS